MMLRRFLIVVFFTALSSFTVLSAVKTEEAQWSAVMAGEVLCDPVLHGEYLYAVTSDHALNCIDEKGSFVWRRTIKRARHPLLTASQEGILIIADSAGLVQAVSSQGMYLWSTRIAKAALYAPYCTAAGRICVLTHSCLYCFSIRGKLKWQLSLPSPPALQICETGAESLLVPLKNKELLTVSYGGQIVRRHTLKQTVTALVAAPDGYIVSTADGALAYHREGLPFAQKAEKTAGLQDAVSVDTEMSSAGKKGRKVPIDRKKAGTDHARTGKQKESFTQKAVGSLDALSSEQKKAALAGAIAHIQLPEKARDPHSTVIWETRNDRPLFMQYTGNELVCVYANGTLSVRNITTNAVRWTVKLNGRITLPVYCAKVDGEYYLTCKSLAAIVTGSGTVKRLEKIQKAAFLPLITPRGMLIAIDNWVVNGWRLDTKIMRHTVQPQRIALPPRQKLTRQEKPRALFAPYEDTAAVLAAVDEAIATGTIGNHEEDYAQRLCTIVMNKGASAYFPYNFTVHERAYAAELLGLLGSLEYRPFLFEAAASTTDPALAVAIIRALGSIASDPDGSSIKTIQSLLRRCGIREIAPSYAACDALTEIAKYGDKRIAGSAVQVLFAIASHAFSENTQQYARQKIKTIVE